MALDTAFFLVSAAVARRAGVIHIRYRTEDGRFVLSSKDLLRIRLSSEEFITGLQDIERIDADLVSTVIAKGGHHLGPKEEDELTNEKEEEDNGTD